MTGTFKHIDLTVTEGIAEIILNKPPLNLLDQAMTEEYFRALEQADRDTDVRVIVLSGAGKGLSGGADIKWMESFDAADMRGFLDVFYIENMKRARALTKPMIAMVHGYAREGALTLAFGADMVIAADDATFGYPAVPNLGAPPGMHTWILPKLMGRIKAAELIFTGKAISAVEAERTGLITRCVPLAELRDATVDLAREIAAMSPEALKRAKRFMQACEDMPFAEVPEAAARAVSDAYNTADSQEARTAFKEKRKPVWKGE